MELSLEICADNFPEPSLLLTLLIFILQQIMHLEIENL